MTVLFRVAAGPRTGFGHLRRAVTLAHALGVTAHVSLRGSEAAVAAARGLGCLVERGSAGRALDRVSPAVLVIDDPTAAAAMSWLRAARARAIPVVSVHDLGLAWIDSDLLVDGSFVHKSENGPRRLLGPGYMAVGTAGATRAMGATGAGATGASRAARATGAGATGARVLIALGGGPRRRHAWRLARAIRRRVPWVEVRIAGGFGGQGRGEPGIVWLAALPSLAPELRAATVAVVAGGVSLYEACALGVPSVAVPVTGMSAQRQTVRAGAGLGAVLDGGALTAPGTPVRAARLVAGLLASEKRRETLSRTARRLVDGQGAARVAARIRRLARKQQ